MMTSRFLLPVVLGVAASGANYMALQRETAKVQITTLAADLKAGEPIEAKHLKPVKVGADREFLKAAILWEERGSLFGLKSRRKLTEGEPMFRADFDLAEAGTREVPPGYESLTLRARRSSVAHRPIAGQHVVLIARKTTANTAQRYGPYLFLGWEAETQASGKESDVVHLRLAIPQQKDSRTEELRAIQATGATDWLVQLEVTVPPARK